MKGSENQGEFWVSQLNKALNWDKLAKNGSRRATIRQPNFMWPELWAENGQKNCLMAPMTVRKFERD